MTRTNALVTFPVYGLSNWEGPQWLDFVEGEAEKPLWSLWLAHGKRKSPHMTSPWVRVGSLPAKDHVPRMMARSETPAHMLAFSGLVVLVNLIMPDLTDEQTRAYLPQVSSFLREQSAAVMSWPHTLWKIDGRDVIVQVFSWSGAWIGFTTDPENAAIIVIGAGVPYDGIGLKALSSGSDYHFDLERAPGLTESSVSAALGPDFTWGQWPLHADQQSLIDRNL